MKSSQAVSLGFTCALSFIVVMARSKKEESGSAGTFDSGKEKGRNNQLPVFPIIIQIPDLRRVLLSAEAGPLSHCRAPKAQVSPDNGF